jgi:two-component system, response regulator
MEPTACDILIVEDNGDDAELMIRSLRKARLLNPIVVLEDGAAAIDYLCGPGDGSSRSPSPPPRIVFLDLKLPKRNGLEVLAQIRADERTRTLPVVVITSSHEEPDIREAYRLGANSYVVKPVEFDRFVETVTRLGLYWMVLNTPSIPAM